MVMVHIRVFTAVELEHTPSDEEQYGDSSEPPGGGNACGETGYDQ
jgi:hypothetical protein